MTSGGLHHGYDVYLVVGQFSVSTSSQFHRGEHWMDVAGLSCGIRYDGESGKGVDVYSWTLCGDVTFANNGWPSSGAGIRLVWTPGDDCYNAPAVGNDGVHKIAGAFYVYAYSEDVLFVTPNQGVSYPEFSIADCDAREYALEDDARGAVRFSASGMEPGYNPCSGIGDLPPVPPPVTPPPPPPPPPPADSTTAALLLHVSTETGPSVGCDDAPLTMEEVATEAPVPEGGADYTIYLLGVSGLGGLQVGLDYDPASVEVTEWHVCTDTEIQSGAWPAPGSGNMVIWSPCAGDELPVAGYFRVSVSGPSVFSLGPHPVSGDVRVANCDAAEFVLLSEQKVGWVSLGGAAVGPDSDGCNPALEPCVRGPVAVVPATWGSLKTRYRME